MKKQFLHYFKGFGIHPSHCYVKIFYDDGENFILFEDIDDGTSVTNASEQLASEIVNEYGFHPGDCRFFETYRQYDYETFDEITYHWESNDKGHVASNPSWKPGEQALKDIFI